MAVATSRIMNINLKILVIESRINNYSSSEYKISTIQVNSYKIWTSSSYKVCRVTRFVLNKIVIVEVWWILSLRRLLKGRSSKGRKFYKVCSEQGISSSRSMVNSLSKKAS